jgi:hypothetical protein
MTLSKLRLKGADPPFGNARFAVVSLCSENPISYKTSKLRRGKTRAR